MSTTVAIVIVSFSVGFAFAIGVIFGRLWQSVCDSKSLIEHQHDAAFERKERESAVRELRATQKRLKTCEDFLSEIRASVNESQESE